MELRTPRLVSFFGTFLPSPSRVMAASLQNRTTTPMALLTRTGTTVLRA